MTVRTPCPQCRRVVAADERRPLPSWFPFCSERCRLVDLGRWFAEDYRLGRGLGPEDVDAESESPAEPGSQGA